MTTLIPAGSLSLTLVEITLGYVIACLVWPFKNSWARYCPETLADAEPEIEAQRPLKSKQGTVPRESQGGAVPV